MKKRNLKSLKLNKKSISNLDMTLGGRRAEPTDVICSTKGKYTCEVISCNFSCPPK